MNYVSAMGNTTSGMTLLVILPGRLDVLRGGKLARSVTALTGNYPRCQETYTEASIWSDGGEIVDY